MIKIIWDIAVDKNNWCICFDIIARKYEGFVVAARSTAKNILVKPVVVEALAAFHATDQSGIVISRNYIRGSCCANCEYYKCNW